MIKITDKEKRNDKHIKTKTFTKKNVMKIKLFLWNEDKQKYLLEEEYEDKILTLRFITISTQQKLLMINNKKKTLYKQIYSSIDIDQTYDSLNKRIDTYLFCTKVQE